MSAVAASLELARSNLAARLTPTMPRRRDRPQQPDAELVARIKALIADMAT